MILAVLLERRLLQTVDLLEQACIDHRVLKGPCSAHSVYVDPALRSYGDVDVLVPATRFDDAVASFRSRGYCERRYAEPRPGFDPRFGKAAAFVTDNDLEVDLHRTFVLGPFGVAINLDDLFDGANTLMIGDRKLQALPVEAALLNACYHAVLGFWPPRLVPLRDVIEILRFPHLDVERVRARTCLAWRSGSRGCDPRCDRTARGHRAAAARRACC